MKIQSITLALSLALLGACSAHEESAPQAAQQAAGSEEPLLAPADAAIPTEEEAAATAQKTIDGSNADAELEKLEKELEAGH